MTHTYTITGMYCQGCVSKVQAALARVAGVIAAEVSLMPPQAVVTMAQHIPTEVLNQAVQAAGSYNLGDTTPPAGEYEALPEGKSFWATYKPLLLVVGFIVGGVLLREVAAGGRWAWPLMVENFMGGFFAGFAFFKLMDVPGFAGAYASYDLVARRWFGYGFVYPFLELALGLLFFLGWQPVWANGFTLVLMLIGIGGVLNALRQKRTIQCACLGTVFDLPMSTVTLVEDGAMALMAACMLVFRA